MTEEVQAEGDIFTFVCSHSDHDDRPPARIPVFTHNRGNGSWAYRKRAARRRERASAALDTLYAPGRDQPTRDLTPRPEPDEPRNEYIDRLIAHDESLIAPLRQSAEALRALNHHNLECPVCGFNERVGGDDLERLFQWAKANGLTDIPLRQARRILALLGE